MSASEAKVVAQLLKKANGAKIVAEFKKLDAAGRDIMLRAMSTELTDARKQMLLAELRTHVSGADVVVKTLVRDAIMGTYVRALNTTVKLANIPVPAAGGSITVHMLTVDPSLTNHLKVAESLVSDAYLDFGKTMTGFMQSGEKILSTTLRKQIRAKIATGALENKSIQQIKKQVKAELVNRGFIGLTDKAGNEWTVDRYSEMLTRTHILDANNQATVNRLNDFNIDIVEVSDHGAVDCPICGPYEGEIYSLSGDSADYPQIPEEPPFHPNCGHRLLGRPDLQPVDG